MKWRDKGVVQLLVLTASVATAGAAPQRSTSAPAPPPEGETAIDPRAKSLLQNMCGYMSGLRSLRVVTTTIDEKVTTTGQKIQELKQSKLEVQRPNHIAVDRTGPAGHVLFRYDGKRFVVYGVERNVYAMAPAPTTLDAALDAAHDQLGIDAPGGDLIATDSYAQLMEGVTEARYVGLEPVDGVMTHHLAMRKGPIDYQLWIQDGPTPVPRRYVITSRDVRGAPQFTLELHDFEPDVPLSESSFAFIPPPQAAEVAFTKR